MPPVYHQLPLFSFEKTCSTCGQTKPLTAFHADKSKPDGLHTTCKECKLEWFRVRQESSPDYRQANKERAAQWRKNNPTAWDTWAQPRIEELKARHRTWVRTHRAQCRD